MRRLVWLALALAACDDGPAGGPADGAPPAADGGARDAVARDGSAADGAPNDGGIDAPKLRPCPGRLDALALGVWAGAPGEVWIAGGGPDFGGGFLARLEGDRFVRVPTPPGPALWWVWGPAGDTARLAVGDVGRILRHVDGAWIAEDAGLPPEATLWGAWGATADDLWAVGGSLRPDGPQGVVLRAAGDGAWTRVDDPALPPDRPLYKVWGAAADDVHLVGGGGVALHWDGDAFRRVETPTDQRLFTVHGRPAGPVLAVGGDSRGVILRWAGDRWVDESPDGAPPLNGVFVAPDGRALAVGARHVVYLRDGDGRWTRLPPTAGADARRDTLHAVWWDADAWAVGGDFVLLEYGRVLTDRTPPPALAIDRPPPPPDATVPDAEPPDADLRDAGPPDAVPDGDLPDVPIPDAAPDVVVPDAAPADAAPDVTVPDARPADAAPDAVVPDAAPPLPGPGEDCPDFVCADDLVCFGIAQADFRNICTRPCDSVEDCAGFGPSCCQVPGPQLLDTYCVPEALLPDGCL